MGVYAWATSLQEPGVQDEKCKSTEIRHETTKKTEWFELQKRSFAMLKTTKRYG